ncbi:hypothetical protein PR048_005302 [Dryococelus australis]|uniref:Reverse transcriptase domain-containing protein n=1 Tax=Dryococelus australis TaxID=614101 RepID=A0ABQ9I7W5_9NEOP|nr:hypothetical protein PR048_005302 [Dryococelus australis]
METGKNNHFTQTWEKSCFPKTDIFEKILIKRIQKVVTQKRLLPNQQIGFRQHYSTKHATTRVAKYIITGNRKFHVALYEQLSSQKNIEVGVPQGSVLSLLLYALYTRDTPKCEGSSFTLYADDTVLYARDRKFAFAKTLLQGHAKKLEEYWAKWAIKINAAKSTLIIFSKSIKKDSNKIKLYGEELMTTHTTK